MWSTQNKTSHEDFTLHVSSAGNGFLHEFAYLTPPFPTNSSQEPFFFLCFFFFLGGHLQHMEVPRLGIQSELQLSAYTTATATLWDPRYICDLDHSSWQWRILNPLSKARDQTWVLLIVDRVCYCWARMGTPRTPLLNRAFLKTLPKNPCLSPLNFILIWQSP